MEDPNLKRFYELIALRDTLKWYQFIKRIRLYFRIDFEVERLKRFGY